ncbi:hypothetical protein IL54_0150 [Sphingobium sp. ba1]|nr:hypothetical protein IL54_0150 [Sphingobium sp. ba1]
MRVRDQERADGIGHGAPQNR